MGGRSWPRVRIRPGREMTSAVAGTSDSRADVSAETSFTDRYTFDCGPSPGTARIGGSWPIPARHL